MMAKLQFFVAEPCLFPLRPLAGLDQEQEPGLVGRSI
jgi:hypothetical protein